MFFWSNFLNNFFLHIIESAYIHIILHIILHNFLHIIEKHIFISLSTIFQHGGHLKPLLNFFYTCFFFLSLFSFKFFKNIWIFFHYQAVFHITSLVKFKHISILKNEDNLICLVECITMYINKADWDDDTIRKIISPSLGGWECLEEWHDV